MDRPVFVERGRPVLFGAPSIALVGSAEDVATAIIEYTRVGVSQFLFMGWPDLDQMTFFSEAILPLVRVRESETPEETGCAYLACGHAASGGVNQEC